MPQTLIHTIISCRPQVFAKAFVAKTLRKEQARYGLGVRVTGSLKKCSHLDRHEPFYSLQVFAFVLLLLVAINKARLSLQPLISTPLGLLLHAGIGDDGRA